MHRTLNTLALLVGALIFAQAASAQPDHTSQVPKLSRGLDLAFTYTPERAKFAGTNCGCFWLQGGSIDAGFFVYHGLGFAANLTAQHASDISGKIDLGKTSYLFGPRYTLGTSKLLRMERETSVFGQAFFGGMHGYDSMFPSGSTINSSANSFAMQIGGGFNMALAKGFGLRVIDAQYVRSSLPNNGNSTQNDLRLGSGITYRIRMH